MEPTSFPNLGDGYVKVTSGVVSVDTPAGGGAVTVQDYTLQTSDPAAPSAGTAKAYFQQVGGNGKPEFFIIDEFTNQYTFEPSRSFRYVGEATSGLNTSTIVQTGYNFSNSGSIAGQVIVAGTTHFYKFPRTNYGAASNGGTANFRANFYPFVSSNGTDRGTGFDFNVICGVALFTANSLGFVGLTNDNTTINANPSANNRSIGFYFDSSANNWKIFSKDTGSSTIVDLGTNFPCNTNETDMYHFRLYQPQKSTKIFYYIKNLRTANQARGYFTAGATDVVPTDSRLTPWVYCATAVGAATGCTLAFVKSTIGIDYNYA